MIELTHSQIDSAAAMARVGSNQAGAIVSFLGTTREMTAGRRTVLLSYECYETMAKQELESLERQARERWPAIEGCEIIHRLGEVPLGEASVLVAVSTPHRVDAFAAAAWIMDELKRSVPIWKQEHWADGTQEWVHPDSGESVEPPSADASRDAAESGEGSVKP